MALFNQNYTNIGSQFGMPLFGVSGVPPFTGNYFWVDETNGSDGNTGGPQDPFASLKQAHASCLANNNDVVFLSGSNHTAVTLAWSKARTHLIGLSPPSQNSRARIAVTNTAATSGAVSPLVNVTASGCIFQNIEVFAGIHQAATQVAWTNAASENYYKNCNFIQTGDVLAVAQAGSRALVIGPGDENLFDGCTIGGDTNVRATNANYTLGLQAVRRGISSVTARSRCFPAIPRMPTSTSGRAVLTVTFCSTTAPSCRALTLASRRYLLCILANASAGGSVVLNNCITVGFTAVATTGPVYVNQISAAGATTTYKGLLAT